MILFRSFNKCCLEDLFLVDANVEALVKRKRKYKFLTFQQFSTVMYILKILWSLVIKLVILCIAGAKFIFTVDRLKLTICMKEQHISHLTTDIAQLFHKSKNK